MFDSTTILRLVATIFLTLPNASLAVDFIKIASFNISSFGSRYYAQDRDLEYISKMLVDANLDLIAIQDIQTSEFATTRFSQLVKHMNLRLPNKTSPYEAFISVPTGDQRYGVIFRDPITIDGEVQWLDEDRDPEDPHAGGKTYFRIPLAIPFRAFNFDFIVVVTNLNTLPKRRHQELTNLRDFLLTEDDYEHDWIILGTINRYRYVYTSPTEKAFNQLLVGDWRRYYRFPLLESITQPHDMKILEAPRSIYSTTISAKKDIFDQFIITRGAYREFATNSPEFGEHVGIINFDKAPPFTRIKNYNAIKRRVSHHRPIWIRFRADLNDDD